MVQSGAGIIPSKLMAILEYIEYGVYKDYIGVPSKDHILSTPGWL